MLVLTGNGCIMSKEQDLLFEKNAVKERWVQYIHDLYNDENHGIRPDYVGDDNKYNEYLTHTNMHTRTHTHTQRLTCITTQQRYTKTHCTKTMHTQSANDGYNNNHAYPMYK